MYHKINRGMTLVEMIITLAVLLVVMSVVGMAFSGAMESFATDRKLQDAEYDARLALLSITRDIRRSEVVGWTGNILELRHETDGRIRYFTETDAVTGLTLKRVGLPVDTDNGDKPDASSPGVSPVTFFNLPNTNSEIDLVRFEIFGLIYDDITGKFIDTDDPEESIDRVKIILIIDSKIPERADLSEISTTISTKRIPK